MSIESMNRLAWCFCAAIGVLACVTDARADATLVLHEPLSAPQDAKCRVLVRDDGFAHVHFQWSDPTAPPKTMDLSLSAFKTSGQPADGPGATVIVGLGDPSQGLATNAQNVEVPASGIEVRLSGSALIPGLDYTGELTTTIGQQSLVWTITVNRPNTVAPFACPTHAQLLGPDGMARLDFARTSPVLAGITARLSAFVSKEQELGQVRFVDEVNKPPQNPLSVEASGDPFAPRIQTSDLVEGSLYSGTVSFALAGHDILQCPVDVLAPKLPKGELMTDIQAVNQNVMLPFLHCSKSKPVATLSVRLFDKTRTHRINGLVAMQDGTTSSPEGSFDLGNHVSFSLNGTEEKAFTQWGAAGAPVPSKSRSLAPGEQLDVGMHLKDLHSGAYAFAVRFAGTNLATEPPKVAIAINVRDHWLWAVIAELSALAASFFLSKGIVNWRERMRIKDRMQQLREAISSVPGDLPTAIFLRSVLAQTKELLKNLWVLAPPPSVYDYLARAQRAVAILGSYMSLRDALDAANCSEPVKAYYREAIANVMYRVGATPLDQATADGITADLNVILTRLADPMVWYWSNLQLLAKTLAQNARPVQAALGDQALVDQKLKLLEVPTPTPNQNVDDAYWLVNLLYSRRAFPGDIKAVVDAYQAKSDLQATFAVADKLAWERLEESMQTPNRVQIELAPDSSLLESLRPLKFLLRFPDQVLVTSYLLRNVARYRWKFEFTERLSPRKRGAPAVPRVVKREFDVTGPRATQFAPFACTAKVSVTISWSGKTIEIVSDPIEIGGNTELSLVRGLGESEIILMLIIAAVALATGLPTLYFAKAAFGSFSDYVAILTWAIGIDQGKNLIQLMKSYSPDGAPAASSS